MNLRKDHSKTHFVCGFVSRKPFFFGRARRCGSWAHIWKTAFCYKITSGYKRDIQPVAGDVSALTSMKNVVKRDMYCDLQSSWVIEFLNACCARGKSYEHVCLSVLSEDKLLFFDLFSEVALACIYFGMCVCVFILLVLSVPPSRVIEKWSL